MWLASEFPELQRKMGNININISSHLLAWALHFVREPPPHTCVYFCMCVYVCVCIYVCVFACHIVRESPPHIRPGAVMGA
jgi:hypothetical protein